MCDFIQQYVETLQEGGGANRLSSSCTKIIFNEVSSGGGGRSVMGDKYSLPPACSHRQGMSTVHELIIFLPTLSVRILLCVYSVC